MEYIGNPTKPSTLDSTEGFRCLGLCTALDQHLGRDRPGARRPYPTACMSMSLSLSFRGVTGTFSQGLSPNVVSNEAYTV